MKTGLVSVSFRKHTASEIITAAADAGLECIEWGSDVHAKYDDIEALEHIARMQAEHKLYCSSYGTYFRLGQDDLALLPEYIKAARMLGTNILRLWCGVKSTWEYQKCEKAALFEDCRAAAAVAERAGVKLCLECHRNTYTETKEGALELMQAVSSPAFRMYWQPNQGRSVSENIEYASLLAPYIEHIHVFQWKGDDKFPLADGVDEWRQYLGAAGGEHTLLLEFMPDGRIESLPQEAESLCKIIKG
ncbi:MAG: TIM barrel protein [Clostridia bacterium]|nr:TIM barrel protein [Clostridia bacterium]